MLSRFDICMAQLESDSAKLQQASLALGDQRRASGSQRNAEPVETARELDTKQRGKERGKQIG